jgi:putative membrane protein
MWHTGEGMGWWMVFGAAMWLVFWAAIVYLVVHLVHRGDRDVQLEDRPVEIARRRYAAGEITKDQYEQLRHDLDERAA